MKKSCIFNEIPGETLRPGGLELTSHIAAIADIKKNQTILEIGCGKGTTTMFLAQQYSCRVTGIDLSEAMVACAQAKAVERNLTGQTHFLVADGEHLPFNDAVFDIVISECTFSLIPDQERAAGEIWRVLKLDGRFILTDIILRNEAAQKQSSPPSCLIGSHAVENYNKFFKKSGFEPVYFEDQSATLKDIIFDLALSCDNVEELTQQLLSGPYPTSPSQPFSPPEETAWDSLIQCKPGYGVFIFSKKNA
jgi:ubiquinone/menaquinone biosynthesis C-methylase UbiE